MIIIWTDTVRFSKNISSYSMSNSVLQNLKASVANEVGQHTHSKAIESWSLFEDTCARETRRDTDSAQVSAIQNIQKHNLIGLKRVEKESAGWCRCSSGWIGLDGYGFHTLCISCAIATVVYHKASRKCESALKRLCSSCGPWLLTSVQKDHYPSAMVSDSSWAIRSRQ